MNESTCHIWGRFGISLRITPSEMENIVCGSAEEKQQTIHKIFADGRAAIDGESYIPGQIIGEYNDQHRTYYDRYDVDLEMDLLEGTTLKV